MAISTDRAARDADTAWLRRYRPEAEGAARRLVCFPHAGGSASFFRPVAVRFAPGVEVLAVQYPGRQDRLREPCIDDIGALADRIAERMRNLPPKPTVFFGHSMGTAVAFETAWRLEQGGQGPRALVVSGWRAPSLPLDQGIHRRDDAGVLAEIRSLGGTEAALLEDEEVLRMAMPAIRADYRAIETYVGDPERRVACPITVLYGESDPKLDPASVRAWSGHTTADFRVRALPGGHFYLVERQREVGDEIAAELDRWTADRG
jgi:surfactin synthase thioesterase subunit